MNQFNLWNLFFYPRRNFVAKIALPVEDNWLLFLLIDITGNNTPEDKVYEVDEFVIGKP